jgi:VWFA-related protein
MVCTVRTQALTPCRWALILPVLLFPSAQIHTQSAPSSAPTPVFKSSTHAVIVDVVVDNGKGEPVSALRKEDFRVYEDGKPQTIDFFEEHTAKILSPGMLQPLPKMPPSVYTNVPPAPEDDAVNVLLLDSLNTPPQMITYARNQILNYLNHVKPGTRIAIFVLNKNLNIVQGFTSDATLLRQAALQQTAPGISASMVTKSEVADFQELMAFMGSNAPSPGSTTTAAPTGGNGPSGPGWSNPTTPISALSAVQDAFANYQGFKEANRARMTLEAIADVARYLSGVPGRKNLIWFAGDFPIVILPKFDQRQEAADNGIELKEIRKVADLLTAARVAVYPVYANGIMSDDIVSSDNRSPASAAGVGNMSTVIGNGVFNDSANARAAEIASMNQLASDTGGKAVYNTNDLDTAVAHSIADGAHYYSLVYTPTNKKMDGKYRSIDVKIPENKYKLAYRRGYNADEDAKAPQQSGTDPLRTLLRPGSPNATQLLFGVRALPASPQPASNAEPAGKNASITGPTTRYSIDFMIRWNDVALAPGPNNTHTGKFEIELLAFDRTGKAVNWNGGIEEMQLTPDVYAAIQRSGIPAHFDIDLPKVPLYLEAGVHDLTTGKVGTLRISLDPSQSTAIASAH